MSAKVLTITLIPVAIQITLWGFPVWIGLPLEEFPEVIDWLGAL